MGQMMSNFEDSQGCAENKEMNPKRFTEKVSGWTGEMGLIPTSANQVEKKQSKDPGKLVWDGP